MLYDDMETGCGEPEALGSEAGRRLSRGSAQFWWREAGPDAQGLGAVQILGSSGKQSEGQSFTAGWGAGVCSASRPWPLQLSGRGRMRQSTFGR